MSDKTAIEQAFECAGIDPNGEDAFKKLAEALAEEKFRDGRVTWTTDRVEQLKEDIFELLLDWYVQHEATQEKWWPNASHIARRLAENPRWAGYSFNTLRIKVAEFLPRKDKASD
jgi:hypothetical protein